MFCTLFLKVNKLEFAYKLNDSVIERCNSFKDLGILFDSKLTFATHINNICNKAMKMLGFIIRNSKNFSNIQTFKSLYFCYVRPILEYGAVIWHPLYNTYVEQLERVQRKFAKFVVFKITGTYPPRGIHEADLLRRVQMPSLLNRRNYMLIQFIFKLYRYLIDCPGLLEQLSLHVPSRSTRQSPVFHLPIPATNILIKTPLFQAMKLFNDMCDDIDANNLSHAQFTRIVKAKFLN